MWKRVRAESKCKSKDILAQKNKLNSVEILQLWNRTTQVSHFQEERQIESQFKRCTFPLLPMPAHLLWRVFLRFCKLYFSDSVNCISQIPYFSEYNSGVVLSHPCAARWVIIRLGRWSGNYTNSLLSSLHCRAGWQGEGDCMVVAGQLDCSVKLWIIGRANQGRSDTCSAKGVRPQFWFTPDWSWLHLHMHIPLISVALAHPTWRQWQW